MDENTGVVPTDVVSARKQIKGMREMVEASKVETDEELALVADKIKQVKTLAKVIKEKKEKFTEPAKAIMAEARETFDPLLRECENAELSLKGKAKTYMLAKEQKRIEEERRIAARVEKGTMKEETAVRKIEAMPEVKNTVKTDNGSALRMAKRSVARIVNPELIPDEYWVIDEVRVRREALARYKANLEPIPGTEIIEETDLSSL